MRLLGENGDYRSSQFRSLVFFRPSSGIEPGTVRTENNWLTKYDCAARRRTYICSKAAILNDNLRIKQASLGHYSEFIDVLKSVTGISSVSNFCSSFFYTISREANFGLIILNVCRLLDFQRGNYTRNTG